MMVVVADCVTHVTGEEEQQYTTVILGVAGGVTVGLILGTVAIVILLVIRRKKSSSRGLIIGIQLRNSSSECRVLYSYAHYLLFKESCELLEQK